jgi:hypothetical protein
MRQRFDQSAALLFGAFQSTPDPSQKTMLNDLIVGLKSASNAAGSIWDQLDVLWMHAIFEQQAAIINLKCPGLFTCSSQPSFTANSGFQGDGAATRLILTWAGTNGINYVQNSAGFGFWSLTNSSNNANDMGRDAASGDILACARNASGNCTWSINDDTATSIAVADSLGNYHAQRRSSTDKRMFKNGSSIQTASVTSTGVAASSLWTCGANSTSFSARRIAFSWAGGPMSGLELAFDTIVRAYLTARGAI